MMTTTTVITVKMAPSAKRGSESSKLMIYSISQLAQSYGHPTWWVHYCAHSSDEEIKTGR